MINLKNFFNLILKIILEWMIFLVLCGIIIASLFFSYLVFEKKYQSRIYPGVYLNDLNLGGLNYDEALKLLNQKIETTQNKGIEIYYKKDDEKQKKSVIIFPVISSLSGDISYEFFRYDLDATVKKALSFGRSDSLWINFFLKIQTFNKPEKINAVFKFNQNEILKNLKAQLSELEIPAQDARLIRKKDNNQGYFEVKPERLGRKIDYDLALQKLSDNLAQLKNDPIRIFTSTGYPQVYKEDCLKMAKEAEKILDRAPFELILETASSTSKKEKNNFNQVINKDFLANWLGLEKNELGKVFISLNKEAENFLQKEIAPKVNIDPIYAKIKIENNKAIEFQTGKNGQTLNEQESLANIKNYLFNQYSDNTFNGSSSPKINLVIDIVESAGAKDAEAMGIKEIIGIGKSAFKGSPSNRRHNIKTGANALNGLIIDPEKEFSLIKALGEIDQASGYLPELVIKGNKTTPEFGGGLCQIGTTLFRTVVNAGLPVTMRQNHSYRVSYYEPAGTDATIYNPMPDFRFVNDTGKSLLIQTYMEGDDLRFEFWGTKDGRIASSSQPTIYNIVAPPLAKTIETVDLKPGEKKCTERAHNGADAYFDYSVIYPDGTQKDKRFKSHYIPWQEVCLVGVEKIETATTTNAVNNEQIVNNEIKN